jgi:hypothetical protein
VRRRRPLTGKNTRNWSTETVYAVTSLTAIQARPAELAAIVRGHWIIENCSADCTYEKSKSGSGFDNRP